MQKILVLSVLLLLTATELAAQGAAGVFDLSNYGVRIEPDKRVMAVLATLEAARTTDAAGDPVRVINTPLSPKGKQFRDLLSSDLAAMNEDLRRRISSFVVQYKKRNPKLTDAELVAPFISMAYALGPAPDLADPVVTGDLPGSLLDVLDFAPLVRDFYRRSSFSANINDYVKTYQAASDSELRTSAGEMVSDLLGYMHTRPQLYFSEQIRTETQKAGSKSTTLRKTEIRERERRFFIVPELLAPAGTVNFVNIKDDYFVVMPPETDLTFSEVRRGFLQFILDPIVLNSSKDITAVRDQFRTFFDESRKSNPSVSADIYLTISRSLVAAVDAKQREYVRGRLATLQAREKIGRLKTDAEKRAVSAELEKFKRSLADETALQLSEDFQKGAVLGFYFAEQLSGIEDSGFDIAASMREMILSFDAAKEAGRYDRYAEARGRAVAARDARKAQPKTVNVIVENPVTNALIEIQKTIDAKNYAKANSDLNALLAANGDEPRIYYNIGRVASLSAQELSGPADAPKQKQLLLDAKNAYEKVVAIAEKQKVDPALVSLSYVALAKIYEFYDETAYAISIYDKVIQLGRVAGGGFDEALAAKQRLIKQQ